MIGCTAEDGLHVLDYLKLNDLTSEERELFFKEWPRTYHVNRENLIITTRTLYCHVLPYLNGRGLHEASVLADSRFLDFILNSERSDLSERLKKGIALTEITANQPERVSLTN